MFQHRRVSAVYTYGQPRVGNFPFALAYVVRPSTRTHIHTREATLGGWLSVGHHAGTHNAQFGCEASGSPASALTEVGVGVGVGSGARPEPVARDTSLRHRAAHPHTATKLLPLAVRGASPRLRESCRGCALHRGGSDAPPRDSKTFAAVCEPHERPALGCCCFKCPCGDCLREIRGLFPRGLD